MSQHLRTSQQLITQLKTCKTLKHFQKIHVHIIHNGLHNDNDIITNFISRFFDKFSFINTNCNKNSGFLFDYANSVFNAAYKGHSDALCNAFLKGHFDHSSLVSSLSVFKGLRVLGFCPDEYTFPSLIKRCTSELDCFTGVGVHGMVVKYGVEGGVHVGSSLVGFYGKCGLVRDARKVFDEMPVRNVVCWTALVVACLNCGELGVARKVFDEMPKRNQVSWNVMIGGYMKSGELSEARRLFDDMPDRNVGSFTTMIDGYAKSGDMTSAVVLSEECLEKDCHLWLALISGYAHNGQAHEALECFREMLKSKAVPDEFIMASVMSACARLRNLQLARELDSYVTNQSSFDCCQPHVVMALVDLNAKCGNMDRAMNLFDSMPKRDLISYCSMIEGYSIHGQGANAVKLFYSMLSEGIAPDTVAFAVILKACSRSRFVDEGCSLFDMMGKNYSIVPSGDHYSCMVDLLGRSGRLVEAYDILKEMPVELHPEAWGTLLGACRLHRNAELVEVVVRQVAEVETSNEGNSVLLSNIYAAADRWLNAPNVRGHLEGRRRQIVAAQIREHSSLTQFKHDL